MNKSNIDMQNINNGTPDLDSPFPPKKKRGGPRPNSGGARPGAGRKFGAVTRITSAEIMAEIVKQTGKTYVQLLVQEFNKALHGPDPRLIKDYLGMIGDKVISTKKDIDITTNGSSMNVQLIVNKEELAEWN